MTSGYCIQWSTCYQIIRCLAGEKSLRIPHVFYLINRVWLDFNNVLLLGWEPEAAAAAIAKSCSMKHNGRFNQKAHHTFTSRTSLASNPPTVLHINSEALIHLAIHSDSAQSYSKNFIRFHSQNMQLRSSDDQSKSFWIVRRHCQCASLTKFSWINSPEQF